MIEITGWYINYLDCINCRNQLCFLHNGVYESIKDMDEVWEGKESPTRMEWYIKSYLLSWSCLLLVCLSICPLPPVSQNTTIIAEWCLLCLQYSECFELRSCQTWLFPFMCLAFSYSVYKYISLLRTAGENICHTHNTTRRTPCQGFEIAYVNQWFKN